MNKTTAKTIGDLSKLYQQIIDRHIEITGDLKVVSTEMYKFRSQPADENGYDISKLKTLVNTARSRIDISIEGFTSLENGILNCRDCYINALKDAKTREEKLELLYWLQETNPVMREVSSALHVTIMAFLGFKQQYILFQHGIDTYETSRQRTPRTDDPPADQLTITKNYLSERDDLPRI